MKKRDVVWAIIWGLAIVGGVLLAQWVFNETVINAIGRP